jgi:hypothetical protein
MRKTLHDGARETGKGALSFFTDVLCGLKTPYEGAGKTDKGGIVVTGGLAGKSAA